jgi:dTDP-4-amino-4,6-dideoxygalactose transaminase
MIPLLDLKRQYAIIRPLVEKAVKEVFEGQAFILGSEVKAFEDEIAEKFQTGHAIGVSSGTDALLLSLMALGVGEGDEVITSPFTFFATAGVIHRLGAIPVFVDIDEETYNLNPEAVEKAITERTACIMPVHIFGLMAEMESIRNIAGKHAVSVVEDAAQAIGAWREINGEKVYAGTVGETGCFSFFPSKNLGGAGDGGMVVTGDPDRAEQLRRLRVHGSYPKYYHHTVGINGRLDALQAAVLRVKLKFLDEWAQKRREHAALYRELFDTHELENYGVSFPDALENAGHVYNQFTGRFPRRDALLDYLKGKGVGAAIYYPLPLHLQPCFRYLGYREGELPHAEKAAKEVLSLPVFPELTETEQETVVKEIQEFYEGSV